MPTTDSQDMEMDESVRKLYEEFVAKMEELTKQRRELIETYKQALDSRKQKRHES